MVELSWRRRNASPLILAFIFITFFHNVLSRHRIRHYRDRFKRQQGANLYLPGSYVTDGGEGPDGGPWSEWSEPSPCSRTCGGGVSSQYRSCTEGYECQGPQSRHFSCNTQDCPDIGDFRSQQCSEYDAIPFQGIYYHWVPYTRAPNPCELNCMPKGERFYYRHAATVVDGTRCDDQSLDVCVAGKCQPVGCDMMLGSSVKEDLCRVCGGNGSTCKTTRDTIPMKDMQVGYNDIILIPAGATNIRVEELGPSNNYLAVRNTSGHYYLNGNWRIDFPRILEFAGCNFHYERSPQGFSAPDIITCLGPTDESLFIVLLYQDSDIPVEYSYSYPTNVLAGLDKTYAWTFDQFTPCSQTCGGGYQFRNVTCAERKTLEAVDRGFCDQNNEPEEKKKCNEIACEAQWTPHPWGQCTVPCGEGGTQTREISCQQVSGDGYPVLIDEAECLKVQPKPPTQQKCNEGKICAQWHSGPWKPCDHLCGDGKQTRQVTCFLKDDAGKIDVLEDSECEAIVAKPEVEKTCNVRPCEGVDWITSEWGGCDRICGLTNETRKVHCATADGQIFPDNLCEAEERPETVRKCEPSNTTCQYLWYASQWSECSVECGEGVQTRTLFCGLATVDGVQKVENDKCDPSKHFETIKNCVGEAEECEGEWFSGPWGKCSKPCGGGERTKKVVCLKDNVVVDVSLCGSDKIVFSHEECNAHACSEDTIMSTDITHPIDESEKTTTSSYEATEESEPTLASDITTEQSDVAVTPSDDADEYEIVPDTNCDDGEWVESKEPLEKLGEEKSQKLQAPTESSALETSFSMDDLMLSDGTTAVGTDETEGSLETGSGETTETSLFTKTSGLSETTDEEGSGTGPTIDTSTEAKLSTEPLEGSQSTSDISGATTEVSSGSSASLSTVSGSGSSEGGSTESGLTTEGVSTVSGLTTEALGSTDVSSSSDQSSIAQSTEETLSSGVTSSTEGSEQSSGSSDVTTESAGSELTTSSDGATGESSISTDSSTGSSVSGSSSGESETTETGVSSSDVTESGTESSGTETTESGSSVSGSDTTDTATTETDTSESDITETTDSTESTVTETTDSSTSESDTTETTEYTDSTVTEIVTSSGSDTTDSSESSGSTDTSGSTESGTSESATTDSTGTSQSVDTTQSSDVTGSGESTSAPESTSPSSEQSETTQIFVIESDEGVKHPTTASSTSVAAESSSVESSGTTLSGITDESTESTDAGTGFSTTAVSGSEGSTEVVTELSTTESGSSGSTEVTTSGGSTESATEVSGTGSTGGTETATQGGSTEAVTEISTSGSEVTETTEYETTESAIGTSVSTEEAVTSTGGAESSTVDIFGSDTTIGETDESPYPTTSIIEIFKKKPRMCKRRKIKACKKTQYGCCWDNITPAEGPFDKGCPTPKTCKESKYGCCDDGVSPALGPKKAGCPGSHCNETLFGCCPDNKTISEGNNNEGCPEPPPKCLESQYGCCDDNATEATGPEHKGCPEEEIPTESTIEPDFTTTELPVSTEEPEPEIDCNNTTYRCCPDGVTVSQGPGFQGCNLPCSNSTFGCCADGATPAHGPSGEGCCLASAFGCCPDNVVPARGPNLDGCGCQYSPYGCCPDNATSARGYNSEGCGCQYTPHGCCPDSFTPANGPNYEGCLCHTFQFGCCPDGLTAARGPHHQGCGCRNTEFGCCSDDETPALGPNQEGCGCVSSKFGCCLDGVSEAKGENFEGCETAPENLQASCSLSKERGKCRNYTVKWFFDMDYGGCSRFWYGGCDGNGNRYKSKEECDRVCVEPQSTERCNLPKVPGPCEGYYLNWYFDKDLKQCAQFIYGGCLGNNNRFETREECMGLCVKDSSVDACEQPKEEGPCRGQYQRYYFDKDRDQCLPFTYGGCQGNNNNFVTVEACSQKCTAPGRKKDHCSLPRAQGNCTERLPRWYHDTPEKRCVPFYYSGCNGNQNNFDNKEACENDCPLEVQKDTCHLAAETGECGNYVTRWYYDTKEKLCRQFYYGGCGGNENNFETEEGCQQHCEGRPKPPPQPEESTEPPTSLTVAGPVPEPFRTDMCFLPSDTGPCRSGTVRYFYDRNDGVCKSFTYGGCEGNGNNFVSVQECFEKCGVSQDICSLPPIVGPCDGEYIQYYYDPSNDTCQAFTFGGCGGNYNRFQDQASCEQRCRKAPPSQVVSTKAPPVASSNTAMCYQPSDPGNCTENYVAFFFDTTTSKCVPFTYTGCGGNDNRFTSEEQCERQCGSFRGQDVCNMERDPGPCKGYFLKYYYDKVARRCNNFAFGGCNGNGNRFSSNEECERVCLIRIDPRPNNTAICQLPVDQGSCPGGYHKRWYFDDQRGECIAFIYSGCGGNFNNFMSFQSCLDTCRNLLPPTQAYLPPEPTGQQPVHPCQEVFDECATLECEYGVEAYVDENECNRCQCNDPCRNVECPEGEQCAIDLNRNKTSNNDGDIIAICRQSNKPGNCPALEPSETDCDKECGTDADCTLHLKCCSTGCGTACVDPVLSPEELNTQPPTAQPAYTEAPAGLQPPRVDPQVFEPEVSGLIGDQAILRCAVTGNPTPKITWSKDNFEIDGTQPRYRIKLDQSLQIITLHKTDSGIYLCTADNRIGRPVTNQVKLEVVDSPPRQATILDQTDEPPLVASLNAPTKLYCSAMGFPFPSVTWWKDDNLVPLKNNEFEVRKDHSLLIHSVKLHNLGIYTCQAYNGVGKASSWSVTLRAKGPYHFNDPGEFRYQQYIVNPPEEPTTTTTTTTTPRPPRFYIPYRPTPEPYEPPPTPPEEISNEIVPGAVQPAPTEEAPAVYVVPVRANITLNDRRYPVGSDIDIPCEVIGYPAPQVQWYKDGVPLYPSDRIQISGSNTLRILKTTKADSGLYQCEATNAYSKASSALEISIEGMYIHPSCTDNQFFANCALIVKANFCAHRYYAKFCCRSCTEAGLLSVDGPHLSDFHKQNALDSNLV